MTTQTASDATTTNVKIARAAYNAYVTKDRAALEAVLASDFHFTSPLDNRLDRETYFRRCWPNSKVIEGFDFVSLVTDADRVFVTYEGRNTNGHRFRNTEILTIRDQRIVDVEVYFGWPVPHKVPQGGFVEQAERDDDQAARDDSPDRSKPMLGEAHVSTRLPAKDLNRARKFYSEKLGLEPVEVRPGGLRYRCGAGFFALFQSAGSASGTHTQMALEVDDIEITVAALRARGVEFEDYDAPGLETINGGERGAWFRDSEGNLLGLGQPVRRSQP